MRIRITSESGIPVSGALVALIDGNSLVVTEALSRENGTRSLRAPAGSYTVRVRRIGYHPFTLAGIEIPRSAELAVQVSSERVVLATVLVTAKSRCRVMDGETQLLWDEISKALSGSQLSMEDLSGIGEARRYRKVVATDGSVVSNETTLIPVKAQRPFGSPDPARLAAEGYVRGNELRGWEYHGPDERVLLSPEFQGTHCFRVVRNPSRAGEVGLAFSPVPGRKLADISGTLWVDEATSELRQLVFEFANAGLLSRFTAGGAVTFRRLASGSWIVQDWKLRAPRLGLKPGRPSSIVAVGYVEDGGDIIGMHGTGTRESSRVSIKGFVYDSVLHRPLAGATVAVGEKTVRADNLGRFEVADVEAGTHVISFSHPSLSLIDLVAVDRSVDLTRSGQEIVLSTPSLKSVRARLCGTGPEATALDDGLHLVHGYVRDRSGRAVQGVPVRLTLTTTAALDAGPEARRATRQAVTNESGHYAVCNLPAYTSGSLATAGSGFPSERVQFTPRAGQIIRRDLTISSRTDSVVQAIPAAVPVTTMDSAAGVSPAHALPMEVIRGSPRGSGEGESRVAEFDRRRAIGAGTFLTREQLNGRSSVNVPQLLQGIPGVRVRLSGSQWMIRSQRCTGRSLPGLSAAGQEPVVLIDGQIASVEQLGTIKVHEIEALEVYQGSSQMPAEVRGRGCFAILVRLGAKQ